MAPPSVPAAPKEPFRWLDGATVALGLLSAMIALAGPSASMIRAPLAFLAAAALLAGEILRRTEASESWSWVRVGPVLISSAASIAAVVVSSPHAPRLASLLGLVCAQMAAAAAMAKRQRRGIREQRESIAQRLDVQCRVVSSGSEDLVTVAAAAVKAGEQVVVLAGEVVGVDGIVVSGEADVVFWLDAQAVGKKREGDPIVAGAKLVSGKLRIAATFTGQERAFARTVLSPLLRADLADPQLLFLRTWLERLTVPAAFLGGGAAFALGAKLPDACGVFGAALSAFSVPTLVTALAMSGARAQLAALARGIVYKDGRAFDLASKADVAVVCSRGTVLLGEPELVSVDSFGLPSDRILSLAAGAETASSHPFALAILHAAKARGQNAEAVRSAVVHPGLGVTALAASGDRIVVGSRGFLLKEKVSIAVAESKLTEMEGQGRSAMLVALAGKLVGVIALQDGLRPGARAAMRRLHDARIEPVLLSGESRETCETIARALEIDHVRPEVLSQERGAEVRALREGGHVVAVIGHPASDDGALGGADASVALAVLGTSPSEWSTQLASDDVRDAALALTLPRAEKERARRALLVALTLPVASVLGVATGVLPVELHALSGILSALLVFWVSRSEESRPH
jgi:cation transport ATPase